MATRIKPVNMPGRLVSIVAFALVFQAMLNARVSTAEERASFEFPVRTCAHSVTVTPDGRFAAKGGCLGLGVIEVEDRNVTLAAAGNEARGVSRLALAPNGRRVAAWFSSQKCVKTWDLKTQRLHLTLPLEHRPKGLAFSPDGDTVAMVSDAVHLWDLNAPDEPKAVDPYPGDLDAIAFSPDGKFLAIACSERNQLLQDCILLWHLEESYAARQMNLPGPSRYLAFSPNGKRLASVGDSVIVWNVSEGKELARVPHATRCAALSHNGGLLATADARTLHLWNASTGKALRSFSAHDDLNPDVYCLGIAFTADGTSVVTAGDRNVKIWDVAKAVE